MASTPLLQGEGRGRCLLQRQRPYLPPVFIGQRTGSQTERPRAHGCVALGPQGTPQAVAYPLEARSRASPAAIGGSCALCLIGGRRCPETREHLGRVPWPLPRPWSCRCDALVSAPGQTGTFVLGRLGRLGLEREGIFLFFVVSQLRPLGGPASALA